MALVKPGKTHSRVEETLDGLQITIPSQSRPPIVLFMGLWICLWTVGEAALLYGVIVAINEGFDGKDYFTLVMLAGWTYFWIAAIRTLLSLLIGKEVIRVSSSELQVMTGALIRSTDRYDMREIKNLRVIPVTDGRITMSDDEHKLRVVGRVITFDYGMSSPYFGGGITEAEANHLVGILKSRFRNL